MYASPPLQLPQPLMLTEPAPVKTSLPGVRETVAPDCLSLRRPISTVGSVWESINRALGELAGNSFIQQVLVV